MGVGLGFGMGLEKERKQKSEHQPCIFRAKAVISNKPCQRSPMVSAWQPAVVLPASSLDRQRRNPVCSRTLPRRHLKNVKRQDCEQLQRHVGSTNCMTITTTMLVSHSRSFLLLFFQSFHLLEVLLRVNKHLSAVDRLFRLREHVT